MGTVSTSVIRFAAVAVMAVMIAGSTLLPPVGPLIPARGAEQDELLVTSGHSTKASFDSRIIQGIGEPSDLSPEMVEDLTRYSRENGVELDLVLAKFRGQNEFEAFLAATANAEREIYVSGGYAEGSRGRPWVRYTAEPSQSTLDSLGRLPFTTELYVGGTGNWAALQAALERLHSAVARTPGVGDVSSEVDSLTDEVTIEFELRDSTQSEAAAARKALTSLDLQGLAALPTKIPVLLREAPSLDVVLEAAVTGGRSMTFGGQQWCTSGFAIDRGGVPGVVTAMHCENSLAWEGLAGVIQYGNAASLTNGGNNIDLQWHRATSGNSASPYFNTSTTTNRAVTGVANPPLRSVACHFGRGSNSGGCTDVVSEGECYTESSSPGALTFCGLRRTEGYVSANGNSGGPWFEGGIARGVHSGRKVIDGYSRSLFTPVSWLPSHLGANIIKK